MFRFQRNYKEPWRPKLKRQGMNKNSRGFMEKFFAYEIEIAKTK
jgi:hypothetical protein